MKTYNKIHKILFILLHVICFLIYLASCCYLDITEYVAVGVVGVSVSSLVVERIFNLVAVLIAAIIIYKSITYIISKANRSRKGLTILCKFLSMIICIGGITYMIIMAEEVGIEFLSLISSNIILNIIKLLYLATSLIIIWTFDSLINNKKIKFEKKDCFLLSIIFCFVVVVLSIFVINIQIPCITNLTVLYYISFLWVPLILNDIYILIKLKEGTKKD